MFYHRDATHILKDMGQIDFSCKIEKPFIVSGSERIKSLMLERRERRKMYCF